MSVSNGENAGATTFNDSYMSRDVDTSTAGAVDLNDATAASGPTVANAQRSLNGQASFTGAAPEGVMDQTPTWSSDVIGTPSETIKARVDAVQAQVEVNVNRINPSTDHSVPRHNGVTGVQQDSGVTISDTDDVVIPGNLQVEGTTTTLNTATLDVEDANITVNNGGTQATADAADAGITVEMSDATDVSVGYDSTLASRFKAGDVGSESEIITSSAAQILTAKDIDLTGTATAANRSVVSSDTTANLVSLARKKGVIYFDDTSNTYKGDDGTSIISFGGTGGTALNDIGQLDNVGLQYSVAASALTVALKVLDGASDPTGGDPVTIGFRNTPDTAGGSVFVAATASLSVVVPSTATLGHADGADGFIYVYAINNAGAIELAVSSSLKDESIVHSTTAITTGSDDDTLYSTTLRSNVAIRLLGISTSNQTTAGTWAALPASESLNRAGSLRIFQTGLIESLVTLTSYGITAGQYGDITSVELTPGEWDIEVIMVFQSVGAVTTTQLQAGVSTTPGNSSTGLILADSLVSNEKDTTNGTRDTLNVSKRGVVVTSTTIYYLKSFAGTSITNLSAGGKISARRIK